MLESNLTLEFHRPNFPLSRTVSSLIIFYLACTHIVYSIFIVMTSRAWARSLEKWEKDVLKGGTVMSKNENKPPQIPSNVFGEYLDAFKKQFTHLHLKGMDTFTAGVLRQFYIICH